MMNPNLFLFFAHYTPLYAHPHAVFAFIYTLLCALETAHTAYTIYFVLIHHCTNSLSPLHIFVHHCTFCASLHTKTSPAPEHIPGHPNWSFTLGQCFRFGYAPDPQSLRPPRFPIGRLCLNTLGGSPPETYMYLPDLFRSHCPVKVESSP